VREADAELRAGGEPCSTPARPRRPENKASALMAFSLRERAATGE